MLTVQAGANRTLLGILAVGLWMVATAGTIASIYWLRQIFLGLSMLLTGRVMDAEAVTPMLVALFGLVATVVIIGSTEYHRRHFLKPGSWKLLAWMIGIEAALAVVSTVLVGF